MPKLTEVWGGSLHRDKVDSWIFRVVKASSENTWRPPRPIFDLTLGSPDNGHKLYTSVMAHSSQASPFHLWKTLAARNFFLLTEICFFLNFYTGCGSRLWGYPKEAYAHFLVMALLKWRQLYSPLNHFSFKPRYLTSFRCSLSWSLEAYYYTEGVIRTFLYLILLIWGCDKPLSCLFLWHLNKPSYIWNNNHMLWRASYIQIGKPRLWEVGLTCSISCRW